ncbi:MAG TPA: ABC transporter permease, partial [Actinomycetota bacterium]|nr:ABC transporter permease [Actinomycetota bacterium]
MDQVLSLPPPTERRGRVRRFTDTVTTSFWLGWKIESSWTDAFKFVTYQIARPIGGALILVFMYVAVARGSRGPVLGFFVVGAAFWPLALGGVQATVRGVIDDRETFRTVRSIYTSPISYPTYLIGRALAGMASMGSAAIVVTLAVGVAFLSVHLRFAPGALGLAVLATVLGAASILSLGILTVAAAFSMAHDAWQMPEGIQGALYLICGAIFPLTVLPPFVRTISGLFPLTWWLEAVRRE